MAKRVLFNRNTSRANAKATTADANTIYFPNDASTIIMAGKEYGAQPTLSDLGGVPSSDKGKANGVASLDANGKVPSAQLPSFVDDVIEGYLNDSKFYSTRSGSAGAYTYSGQITGETGKIYVELQTGKTYRWSGSAFAVISETLALGSTSSTAYRGDYGAAAYKHAVTNKGAAYSAGLYKITTNAEGHVTAATAVAKADITALGIPSSDTKYSAATQSAAGLMSAADKKKLDGVAAGADVTGNCFSGFICGDSGQIDASKPYDTVGISPGDNISITKSSDGKGAIISATDTTYKAASQSAAGLMSADDKKKLDGIASSANKYVLPDASDTVVGGAKLYSADVSADGASPGHSGAYDAYYIDNNVCVWDGE